jgi:hypothetical protein
LDFALFIGSARLEADVRRSSVVWPVSGRYVVKQPARRRRVLWRHGQNETQLGRYCLVQDDVAQIVENTNTPCISLDAGNRTCYSVEVRRC